MKTYTTVQGDCWDLVAFKVYGSEKYMALLADANPSLLDFLVFPSGTVINIPDIPEGYDAEDTVVWRQPDIGESYSSVEEGEDDE